MDSYFIGKSVNCFFLSVVVLAAVCQEKKHQIMPEKKLVALTIFYIEGDFGRRKK